MPAPAYRPARAPTVKNVHLGEILYVLAGLVLVGIGFENLGVADFGLQYVALGLFAVLAGLFFLALVIMPHLLRELSQVMGMVTLVLSLITFLWGLAVVFGNSVGVYGGLLVSAGLASLISTGLKEGMFR